MTPPEMGWATEMDAHTHTHTHTHTHSPNDVLKYKNKIKNHVTAHISPFTSF
jgi:hypothetical protein